MERDEILAWLRETNEQRLETLWRRADDVRRACVGDAVHLRGLVELSNHCRRSCAYCGIRRPNRALPRYRLTEAEVRACAQQAVALGYGTIVMQSGEDEGLDARWLAALLRRLKAETPLAITLSLGERDETDLAAWRGAGADRYLLRFETSNRRLYDRIHPPIAGRRSDRLALLRRLRALGYEIGSGIMIGIPGQTYADVATDLELFRRLDLDMIGLGPYLPHPKTPLGRRAQSSRAGDDEQAPNTEAMTYRVLALTRILCPEVNLPSTTALATLNRTRGRQLGLLRGANVVMPNLTPVEYRPLYEIYPGKACRYETPQVFHGRLVRSILSMGRAVGSGPGASPAKRRREADRQPPASRRRATGGSRADFGRTYRT